MSSSILLVLPVDIGYTPKTQVSAKLVDDGLNIYALCKFLNDYIQARGSIGSALCTDFNRIPIDIRLSARRRGALANTRRTRVQANVISVSIIETNPLPNLVFRTSSDMLLKYYV